MKRHALTLMLSLLFVAGSAVAQSIDVRGDVPFNFIVGKQALAAGKYEIKSMGSADNKTLLIRDSDGNTVLIAHSNSAESLQRSGSTKLVFNRYGDRYFLSQIWMAGATLGHEFPKSAREAEMASSHPGESVVVLAQLR